jgi:hypothetical protein
VNTSKMKKSLILVALGASTFLFGGVFGPASFGCNYALQSDYQALLQDVGSAAIQQVSDTYLAGNGDEFDAVVRDPATNFAQSVWANWVDVRVPDDVEVR